MPKTHKLLPFAAIAVSVMLLAASAPADQITPSHLAAAHETVVSSKASANFDDLLPVISQQVQNQLITLRPDLYSQISDAVQATVLQLVGRRADLDNDVARIWANAFSEDELKAIAAFYQSPAGQKFVDLGPKVVGDTLQAAKGWSDRVREELLEKSRAELKKRNIEF